MLSLGTQNRVIKDVNFCTEVMQYYWFEVQLGWDISHCTKDFVIIIFYTA